MASKGKIKVDVLVMLRFVFLLVVCSSFRVHSLMFRVLRHLLSKSIVPFQGRRINSVFLIFPILPVGCFFIGDDWHECAPAQEALRF